MPNQLDYIFGELNKINGRITRNAVLTDENMAHVARVFKKQGGFNKRAVVLAAIVTGYLYFNERRINKLEKEIKELNQMKGE